MSNPPTRTDVLIEPDELRRALASASPPAVLDIRWSLGGPDGASEYAAGHIPMARYLDLETELSGPVGQQTGRHPLPAIDDLQDTLRRKGVRQGQVVVVYDAATGMSAARGWWLLRWAGLSNVRLLDGGLRGWAEMGGEVTTDTSPSDRGDVSLSPAGMPTLTAADVPELVATGILLDARAAERYRGEVEPIDRAAGHIPGALNAPTTENVDAAGRFLDTEALRQRFAGFGISRAHAVGVYCGSGITAAHQVLALAAIGVDAALYPGSWSEWVSDQERPVTTGERPAEPRQDTSSIHHSRGSP